METLTFDNFHFEGAYLLPKIVGGNTTAYSPAAFTLKKTDGALRFFSDAHIDTGMIYEAVVPALRKAPPYATARPLTSWPDPYFGKRPTSENGVVTNGLYWTGKRLMWVFGRKYWTSPPGPTFGSTDFTTKTAYGPFKTPVHHHRRRGGVVKSPHGLLHGLGGYFSIEGGLSYGPALSTAAGKELLAYPHPYRCIRPPNYVRTAAKDDWVAYAPVSGRGTWTALDEIGGENHAGGAAWIWTPTVRGVVFFASLGTGRVAYEPGGLTAEGREDWLYVFDPADIAKVKAGTMSPWEPTPTFTRYVNQAPGLAGRAAGCAWDGANRLLYVNHAAAYKDGEELYPAVSVYRVS